MRLALSSRVLLGLTVLDSPHPEASALYLGEYQGLKGTGINKGKWHVILNSLTLRLHPISEFLE